MEGKKSSKRRREEFTEVSLKVGQLIRKRKIEQGFTQTELARKVSITQPDLSKIEEGKKNITLFTLGRICKVLGIKKIEL